jgi:hypothetical protein
MWLETLRDFNLADLQTTYHLSTSRINLTRFKLAWNEGE